MHDEMSKHLDSDIIVMCAAVSDYKVEEIANEKIKSTKSSISLDLYPTTDIIKSLAKNTEATIVAFALETSNGKKNALKKCTSAYSSSFLGKSILSLFSIM